MSGWVLAVNPTWRGNWRMRSAQRWRTTTVLTSMPLSESGNPTTRSTPPWKLLLAIRIPLPHELIAKLLFWVDAYVHSTDAARLHRLPRTITAFS